MASCGIDRRTGRPLTDFDHICQSIGVILTTRLGERVMREWVGFPGYAYLGELMNSQNLIRLLQLISITLTLRQLNGLPIEPRFRVVRITPLSANRAGFFECRIDGEEIPRGHLGDFTPARRRSILLTGSSGVYSAQEIASGAIDGTFYV